MSNDLPKFLPLQGQQNHKQVQQSVPNLSQEISASYPQAQQVNSHRSEVRIQPQEHATNNKQYFSETPLSVGRISPPWTKLVMGTEFNMRRKIIEIKLT